MSRWVGIPGAAITAALNWVVFFLGAQMLHSSRPEFIATILIVSLVIHELAHLITMEAYGIKGHIAFLAILGGAMPDKDYERVMQRLPWTKVAAIALAGATACVIVIIVSFLLGLLKVLPLEDVLRIVSLNGWIILLCLIPRWMFDGGYFIKALFNSISEDRDARYVEIMTSVIGIAMIALLVYKAKHMLQFIPVFFLIFWGLQFWSTHDNPRGSRSQLAMTRTQQARWAVYYVFLVIVGLVAAATIKTYMV
ncbi:hypothetical protein KJ782_03050 [Patescibacteria group bacterium]|nr:hypothetical protein [Patescibacteria group bacterium]